MALDVVERALERGDDRAALAILRPWLAAVNARESRKKRQIGEE